MGIASMALGGAVVGTYTGCVAEYTLSRGVTDSGQMCRACVIGGEAGVFIGPVFYTKGDEQGYQAGYKQGQKNSLKKT